MLSAKELKKEAAKSVNREFIAQAGAVLLPSVCFLSLIYTGITFSDLLYTIAGEAAFDLAFFVLLLFVVAMTVPLLYGYAVFQTNCASCGHSDFSDMFCAFSSSELYFRSFKMFYSLLWRFALVFAIPAELINGFLSYTSDVRDKRFVFGGFDFAYTIQVFLIIIAIIAAFLVFGRYILSVYITAANPAKPVSQCFFAAKIFRKNSSHSFSKLAFSFVPLVLLGIFTFGIALIYIIPLIFTAFFMLAHRIYCDAETSKKITNMIFN